MGLSADQLHLSLDAIAQKKWDDYSAARDEMLARTGAAAPWICVRSDHKKTARLNIMRYLIAELAPKKIAKAIDAPDPYVVFPFSPEAIEDGRLAR